jgi:hypothetical protein
VLRKAILPVLAVLFLSAVTLPANAQSTPATTQCPALQMDNPNPGDSVMPGGYVVSGIAFDPAASVGSGVARVDFFLGSRDEGGLYLGTVLPIPAPGGPPRFQTQLTIPKMTSAAADFVAYAFSATSSAQTTVAVPVRIGDIPPSRTPQPAPAARITSNCVAALTPVSFAPPSAAEIAFTPTPGPQLSGTPLAIPAGQLADQPGVIFELSNPSSGDLLPFGGYVVAGTAYDPASAQGPGVDRIQFFLDPRENGGFFIGSTVPHPAVVPGAAPRFSTTLFIPSNAPKGSHILTAYARSSVIGAETILSVPVFVGALPTPTPLPA